MRRTTACQERAAPPDGGRRSGIADGDPRRSEGELHRLEEPEREKGGEGVPEDQQLTLEASVGSAAQEEVGGDRNRAGRPPDREEEDDGKGSISGSLARFLRRGGATRRGGAVGGVGLPRGGRTRRRGAAHGGRTASISGARYGRSRSGKTGSWGGEEREGAGGRR